MPTDISKLTPTDDLVSLFFGEIRQLMFPPVMPIQIASRDELEVRHGTSDDLEHCEGKLHDLSLRVLYSVALNPGTNRYLVMRALKSPHSSTMVAFNLLTENGFISRIGEEKFHTGLPKISYAITTFGIAKLLVVAVFSECKFGKRIRSDFPAIIKKNAELPFWRYIARLPDSMYLSLDFVLGRYADYLYLWGMNEEMREALGACGLETITGYKIFEISGRKSYPVEKRNEVISAFEKNLLVRLALLQIDWYCAHRHRDDSMEDIRARDIEAIRVFLQDDILKSLLIDAFTLKSAYTEKLRTYIDELSQYVPKRSKLPRNLRLTSVSGFESRLYGMGFDSHGSRRVRI
jgi:hypothetical protein